MEVFGRALVAKKIAFTMTIPIYAPEEIVHGGGNEGEQRHRSAGNGMSQRDKLLDRLKSKPKDFIWNEMRRLMAAMGYRIAKPGKTSGSKVSFIRPGAQAIIMHRPHPDNIAKEYAINETLARPAEEGLI